jgi:tetratricopeptide (TPR) repeat protein
MPRTARLAPSVLPQREDSWVFAIRKLRTWIADESEEPVRAIMMLLVNRTEGMILASEIVKKVSSRNIQKFLIKAMTHPDKKMGMQPGRPARIIFEDQKLFKTITPVLQEIQIRAIFYPKSEAVDEVVRELETYMSEGLPEIPGLFSGKGVNRTVAAALFEAAAEFYRQAPWVQLGNDDFLAVRISPRNEQQYICVLGQAGVEYGLALYKHWEDIELLYRAHDHPLEIVPEGGMHSLLFNPINMISFDDLDDIERYGWDVAGPQAYPFPAIFLSNEGVARPDLEEIHCYEALLRAIPELVKNQLQKNPQGEIDPLETKLTVMTSGGSRTVEFKYPAGGLPLEKMSALEKNEWDYLESDETNNLFDLRMMEGAIANKFDVLENSSLSPQVQKAQQTMYRAWDETNAAKRLRLAHQALKESEDCADAYVLLAEEEADTLEQAFKYYQDGMAAGERGLGKRYFKENAGQFWGLLETRPYMRALAGKANCLWRLKRWNEAIKTYQELLRLNPGDNQGIRYILVDLFLGLKREDEVEKLLASYDDDWSTVWLYTQALLTYRSAGPSAKANRKLKDALKENLHVSDYLTGKKRIPNRLPETLEWGGESEAVDYASNHINYWRSTPGAIQWLKEQQEVAPLPARKTHTKGAKKQNRQGG